MQCVLVAVAAEHNFSIESFRLFCSNNRPSPHFHESSQLSVYETPSGTPKQGEPRVQALCQNARN